jgi:hypothetical protein
MQKMFVIHYYINKQILDSYLHIKSEKIWLLFTFVLNWVFLQFPLQRQALAMFSHYSSFIPLVLVLFVWRTFVMPWVTVTNISTCNNNIFHMSAIWESANWTRQFGIRQTGNRQFGMLPPLCLTSNLWTQNMTTYVQYTWYEWRIVWEHSKK